MMRIVIHVLALALVLSPALAMPALAADDSKVKSATSEVESGAKKFGQGVEDTAKGVGETVEEGAKYTGEKFKESGKAAEAPAKSAWQHTKEGATSFGRSVKNFFATLFGTDD
jgi:hypothetical protein